MKDFKNIEEKKGYRVDKKDREIFEREVRRGIFGLDVGDIIEFIVYDSNDNALPQESSNGKPVRYISYTDTNIKKYFSKADEIVVMFPDHGSRYMSKIYSEEWMEQQGFFDSDHESQQQIEYVNELNENQ